MAPSDLMWHLSSSLSISRELPCHLYHSCFRLPYESPIWQHKYGLMKSRCLADWERGDPVSMMEQNSFISKKKKKICICRCTAIQEEILSPSSPPFQLPLILLSHFLFVSSYVNGVHARVSIKMVSAWNVIPWRLKIGTRHGPADMWWVIFSPLQWEKL